GGGTARGGRGRPPPGPRRSVAGPRRSRLARRRTLVARARCHLEEQSPSMGGGGAMSSRQTPTAGTALSRRRRVLPRRLSAVPGLQDCVKRRVRSRNGNPLSVKPVLTGHCLLCRVFRSGLLRLVLPAAPFYRHPVDLPCWLISRGRRTGADDSSRWRCCGGRGQAGRLSSSERPGPYPQPKQD